MADSSWGWPEGPFSITTTLRCRGGHYTFPWIAPFTLDLYLIMPKVKQGDIMYHFLSLWYDSTRDWTQSPRPLAFSLSIMPMYTVNFVSQNEKKFMPLGNPEIWKEILVLTTRDITKPQLTSINKMHDTQVDMFISQVIL